VIIAPERFASRRDTLAFIVCILLSLSARVAPPPVQQAIASAISNTLGRPLLWIQNQAEIMRAARVNVVRLTAQRDSTVVDSLQLYVLAEENAQLRELLSLTSRMPTRHVAAEVLRQASPMDEFTMVLSAGRDRGVFEMAPVISPRGLVGVVRRVDASTSVAVVWTHPDFRASAMTADGSVFGIVEPRGSAGPYTSLMEIRGIAFRDEVPIGSQVFTSGRGSYLGSALPRGIPIGFVRMVAEQNEGWSKTYIVEPAVQPGSVSHVIILLGSADDIASSFGPEFP
jgi:cell shape-determining protein MreC